MKLNDKTDYSLRVLIYLLSHDEKSTVREISEFYQISYNHLRVIAHELSKLGLIETSKGSTGGISLSSTARKMSVASIVKHFEGTVLVECFDKVNNQCVLSPGCRLKSVLARAQKKFFEELQDVRVEDLV